MKLPALLLLLILNSTGILAQKNQVPAKYRYPIDQSTQKITFTSTLQAQAPKGKIYKRLQQFLALQNFDRVTEVKTKTGGYYRGQIVDKAILYQDEEDGKMFCNGFADFVYRNKKYFVLTFNLKLYFQDNECRYVLSDFEVKEFIHLGKSKHSVAAPYGPSAGGSKMSGGDIRTYSLESFTRFSDYEDSDPILRKKIEEIGNSLRLALDGNL